MPFNFFFKLIRCIFKRKRDRNWESFKFQSTSRYEQMIATTRTIHIASKQTVENWLTKNENWTTRPKMDGNERCFSVNLIKNHIMNMNMNVQVLWSMLHAIFVVCPKLIFAWCVLFIYHLMVRFFFQCSRRPFLLDVPFLRSEC